MHLQFDPALCVRATSKFSACEKCIHICPVETIRFTNNLPSFTPSVCVDCGGCVGVCPTEAFGLKDFSSIEFFFSFLKSTEKIISCKSNVPCLSLLNVEYLISLALGSEEPIVLDLAHCAECPIRDPLLGQIQANIEEANFILSAFSQKQLQISDEKSEFQKEPALSEDISRRDFLSNISIKGAIKHKEAFMERVDEDEERLFEIDSGIIAKIKDKKLPNKRKALFTTLKRTPKPLQYETIPSEEISFSSQKYVTEDCTNCQICYRICPTGALSSDSRFSLIHFDAMLCLKCHLCHDACEPKAILLQDGFEIKEFFEPTQRTLALFNIRRCQECGANFTYRGGEQICPRCAAEEEEAIALHANAKKMGL